MNNLVIMPTERKTLNLGEYAEEATIIVEETAKPSITFLEAKQSLVLPFWKQIQILSHWKNLQTNVLCLLGLTWNQPFHTKTLFLVCMKLQIHSMQVKR